MHEWSLAEAVISTAVNAARKEDAEEISGLKIKVGELQQVSAEIFRFALKRLAEGTIAENAEFEIEPEEALLKCRVCDHEWLYREAEGGLSQEESEMIHFIPDVAHTYIRCPKCQSPDFEIKGGRGVKLASVQLER